MKLTVIETKKETPTIVTVKLKPDAPINFRAGQYLVYKLDVQDARGNSRQFSIASSPTENFILVSFRQTGSPFKTKLASLKKGDKIDAIGPLGHFILNESKPAIMLSGGIGITPLRSMIKYATDKKLSNPITLFYSNRTPEEIAFKKELDAMQKENKNLKIVHTITNMQDSKQKWNGLTGFIDEKMIRDNVKIDNSIFYICGPPAMVEAMMALLRNMGIKEADAMVEHFTGY